MTKSRNTPVSDQERRTDEEEEVTDAAVNSVGPPEPPRRYHLYQEEEGSTESHPGPSLSDPPENCHLTVKKLPKTLHFFKKNCQKFSVFSKKLPMAIFLKKMKIFGNFF